MNKWPRQLALLTSTMLQSLRWQSLHVPNACCFYHAYEQCLDGAGTNIHPPSLWTQYAGEDSSLRKGTCCSSKFKQATATQPRISSIELSNHSTQNANIASMFSLKMCQQQFLQWLCIFCQSALLSHFTNAPLVSPCNVSFSCRGSHGQDRLSSWVDMPTTDT